MWAATKLLQLRYLQQYCCSLLLPFRTLSSVRGEPSYLFSTYSNIFFFLTHPCALQTRRFPYPTIYVVC